MKLLSDQKYQCPEMLFSLDKINMRLKTPVRGVLHVGANYGEETNEYRRRGIKKVIWFEPLSFGYDQLPRLVEEYGDLIFKCAIGDENKMIKFNVANNIVSSSIRPIGLHIIQDPSCYMQSVEEVPMRRLDDLIAEEGIDLNDYNFMNIDVQGCEDQVIKGGIETVKKMDALCIETNIKDAYIGCMSQGEIQELMTLLGFIQISSLRLNKVQFEDIYIKT